MLPVIALVGRPNVGKSTLFNRLTRTRDALVADTPGLTRDRQYGIGRLGPVPYVVVDTGGLGGETTDLAERMAGQVERAIAEADHLLFLVDAHDGCVPGDAEIATRLRRLGKSLTLVVNKTDQRDPDLATADFHLLGLGDPVPIAAVQGRGVAALMERVLTGLANDDAVGGAEAADADEDPERIQVAIVGRPNAGKSTLINRLLGEERVVTYDSPGTTRDTVFIPFDRLDGRYTLIDTAGVRRRARVQDTIEKFSVIKTLQAIAACHVVILVVDARAGIGEHDATLAGHILESGRALVVAVNKWDGLDPQARQAVKDDLGRKLAFLDFAAYHFISALHGSGVGLLFDEVDRVYANATRDLSTPELTRLLEAAVQEHQPPLVHGRRIKLRYAHQGGRNPPLIVIHGTQTDAVPASYQRYLVNRFRRELKLQGTPLRIELRSGTNPFAGRRNKLTPHQLKKRRRLREHVARRR
ncbi:ribosome-associated GTPase EngA [Thioflavicoccus mobilis 8321]|uniref:GTPase Der n=1 Tax=Thioflavicoccus mobilis 8321 TaxID=765912 RepID=L0GV74_9GAMM|nr:ribosome biogenesis GTPase Der [Thioflavicoccus mobilis]AGA90653.1 ribosome-associated GTPase EngA [Thioflavicoccus mobilis 8321]